MSAMEIAAANRAVAELDFTFPAPVVDALLAGDSAISEFS